jgi:lysophospholipase L1-like esterase
VTTTYYVIIAALALLFALTVACTGDDAADLTPTTLTAAPSRGPALYLAFGDSLSAGDGASVEDETGFVPLVHAALPQEVALLNLGKPGDDSFELLDGVLLDRGVAEIESRLNDGVDGNEVRVVTLEIGGNDALDTYLAMVGRGDCPSVTESFQRPQCVELLDALASYRPNLHEILARIRAAGPDVPIFLMTVYNLFSLLSGQDLDGDGIPDEILDEMGELLLEGAPGTAFPEGVNDFIRSEGAVAGATVVDWFPIFDGNGGALIAMDLLHPNDQGYRLMADAIIDAARAQGLLD